MSLVSTKLSSRIFYRHSPSGEHRYRLVPLVAEKTAAASSLVYSAEVDGSSWQKVTRNAIARRPGRLPSGFGSLPQRTHFTKLARQAVRNGCAVLDRLFKKSIGFFTATIPAGTQSSLQQFASWSGYAIRRLRQLLVDQFPGTLIVFVWEYQKRGTLHLHVAAGNKNTATISSLGDHWRRLWCQVLTEVSAKCGLDLFKTPSGETYKDKQGEVRTDAQWCRKSVGAYLAKYLSKGAQQDSEQCFYCPSRWWGMSNFIRTQITALTVVSHSKLYDYNEALELFECLTSEAATYAMQCFWWKGKYNKQARTFIWYEAPITGADGA